MKKKINIFDIAKKSGYSTSSVSRTISNPSSVSEKTRVKITSIIKKMGYVHNSLAGSLKSGKSGFIIAIIPTLRDSIFTDYIRAIKEQLRKKGYQLLIGVTDYNLEREEEIVRKFLSYKPEGIIIVGTQHTSYTNSILLASRLPIVETWNITDYLLSLKYKRIAFATPDRNHMKTENRSKRRLSGYLSRIKEAQIKPTIYYYSEPMDHKKCGSEILKQYNRDKSKIDCIICGSEDSGIALLSTILFNKIKVPKNIGVAAVGNAEITSLIHPQLTTIDFKAYEIGKIAAQNLIARINNLEIKRRIFDVGIELIKGNSTVKQKN